MSKDTKTFDIVSKQLKADNIPFHIHDNHLDIHGLSFEIYTNTGSVQIELDPAIVAMTFPILQRLLSVFRTKGVPGTNMIISLEPSVYYLPANAHLNENRE